MRRKIVISVILLLSMGAAFAPVFGEKNPQERILEEVDVVNALVTVRVYHKGKPVKGLQRRDFRLREGGRDIAPDDCRMHIKQLSPNPPAGGGDGDAEWPPRLFVLVFNVSDYRLNIDTGVDYFFDRVLRPNDQVMVMTNRFFIESHRVMSPRSEKQNVKKLLRLEMKYAKGTMDEIENTMGAYIDEYNDLIAVDSGRRQLDNPGGGQGGGNGNGGGNGGGGVGDGPNDPYGLRRMAVSQFVVKYCAYLKQVKESLLNIPTDGYIRLARYLESREMEKWVLNFYQIPRFPRPQFNTEFEEEIRRYGYSMDILAALLMPGDDTAAQNIGPLFADSGATVHTMLLKYYGDFFNDGLKGFLGYRPITHDSEEILKSISRMTGGKIFRSNGFADFYQKITAPEDVYYVLSYKTTPRKGRYNSRQYNSKQHTTLSIQPADKHKNYKMVYDNRKRTAHFRRVEGDFLKIRERENPHIRLKQIEVENDVLRVLVENYKTGNNNIDNINNANKVSHNKSPAGRVELRLQFLDRRANVVLDRKRVVETTLPRLYIGVKLSSLRKGRYDVVIMIKDLNTGRLALTTRDVTL